ncbi:hypothetical protein Cni_G29334 [Canna indica]|uniref:Phytocyanin domain-containing protein n=1 Tax=Canna indica TaxID=4628 RepID=A0AAQ3L4Y2_9LILI|nr:hypothetical protein Cni_G29334 [Canna indica]
METSSSSSPSLLLLLLHAGVLTGWLTTSSAAYNFYVGGRDGWVSNPSESYSDWAGRNRFQVNDTLVFKYKSGADSVLLVSKEDYDACDVSRPIQKLEGGDSEFQFDRSGPFYFVSGVPGNCRNGQKLVVVVLAPRNKNPSSLPPTPPPPSLPPSPSLPSPAPSSATTAPSPSPSFGPSPSITVPPSVPPSPAFSPSPSTSLPPSVSPNSPSSSSGSSTGIGPSPPPESPSSSSSLVRRSKFTLGLLVMIFYGALLD